MQSYRVQAWYRRGALFLALFGLVSAWGCGASSGGSDTLAPATRTAASMDGFVFVPSRSRQTAAGDTSIPHALIRVFLLPRSPGDTPIFETQADSNGFYRIDFTSDPDQVLGKGIVVIATDPFDPARVLSGVISFQDVNDDKNRNLTPTSTIAARVVENEGLSEALSDSQVSALENLADTVLSGLPADADPTTDVGVLSSAANTTAASVFGVLELTIFSSPSASAVVRLNGTQVATVPTALPVEEDARATTVSGNTLTIDRAIIGTATLSIAATGFVTDEFTVDIVGGETTSVERTLLPQPLPGQNLVPVIVSSRITPQTLPFQGGQVQAQAEVRDPEAGLVTGTFAIRRTVDPNGTSEVFSTGVFSRSGNQFTANIAVPGNPNSFNLTYTVVMTFTDGDNRPPVRRVRSFQVSGVDRPPTPPDDSPDSGARALIGQWSETDSGPSADALSASSGRTLAVFADARLSITSPSGLVEGTLQILQDEAPARLSGPSFEAELTVTSSTDSSFTLGESIPLHIELSEDLLTLLTVLRVGGEGQEAVQWVRSLAAE